MDPNQNNQNPESTGESRQAIFTPQPPEPAVDANGQPASLSQSQPSPNLSHPYFSNHPTQTFAVETGDIILNNGNPKPKHNKRPFIIGGVILAIFVIVCIIILVVVSGGSKPTTHSSLADIRKSFNRYSNYLLYGTTSDVLNGDYDPYVGYKLDEQFTDTEIDMQYWKEVSELLEATISSFTTNELETEAENDVLGFLQDQKMMFDFLYAYRQSNSLDQEILMRRYLASGHAVAEQYIAESLKPLQESTSPLASDYLQLKNAEYNAGFALLDIYREHGCIDGNNSLNETCIDGLYSVSDLNLDSLSNNAIKYQYDAELLIDSKARQIESECWTISHKIQSLIDGGEK